MFSLIKQNTSCLYVAKLDYVQVNYVSDEKLLTTFVYLMGFIIVKKI